MCVNEVGEFVGQRGELVVVVVVGIRYWVHGVKVKRGGGRSRSVREKDRHYRQVLVTVQLSFALCKSEDPEQLLVHVGRSLIGW